MSNTSATPGYLIPTSAPATREAFEDALQAMVTGVTGLPGELVRPRFQPKPPRRPDHDQDWCAIGPHETKSSQSLVVHCSDGDGMDEVITITAIDVLASFYGPGAMALAVRLGSGLMLAQNRTALRRQGIVVSEIGKPVNAPEMVNRTWVPRVDLILTVQRETRQTYGVLNIVDAPGGLVTDTGQARPLTPKP